MSKLISNPTECGYLGKSHFKCYHPLMPIPKGVLVDRFQCNTDTFPIKCPLQAGIPIPKDSKELAQLLPSLLSYKDKPKRRNRKDCINYETFSCQISSSSHPPCLGVTCGCFKTK